MFEFSRLQKKCYPFDGMASDIAKMDEYDIENSRLSGDYIAKSLFNCRRNIDDDMPPKEGWPREFAAPGGAPF